MKAGECRSVGCGAAILPTQCFCEKHMNMLPTDVRRLIERSFRSSGKPSARFLSALEHARREIMTYVLTGHRVPRDTDFEWDDDESRF